MEVRYGKAVHPKSGYKAGFIKPCPPPDTLISVKIYLWRLVMKKTGFWTVLVLLIGFALLLGCSMEDKDNSSGTRSQKSSSEW